jgi:hypothetical protein
MNDPAVLRLFARQYGVVTTAQLIQCGVPERSIRFHHERAVIERILPGVWRSVSHPATFESRSMAVQLHVGTDGALSGPTAGHLHGLRSMPRQQIYVAIGRRSKASVPEWVARTAYGWLDIAAETVLVKGTFKALSPRATLATLAELFNDHRFERAAEDAWHLGLVTPDQAADFLDAIRGRGRKGVARLDRWLDKTAARGRPSQSGFELEVIEALCRAGLPEPQRQFPLTLASGEVIHLDIAWPEAMLAVEPGHSWWHGGDVRMTADYERDGACGEVGWLVRRLSETARQDLTGAATRIRATYFGRLRQLRPQTGS